MKTKAIHGNSKITSSGFIITTPIHNILYLSSITRDLLYHILNSLIFKNSVSYPWFCSHSLANWQQYYIHTMCVYIYTHTHTCIFVHTYILAFISLTEKRGLELELFDQNLKFHFNQNHIPTAVSNLSLSMSKWSERS